MANFGIFLKKLDAYIYNYGTSFHVELIAKLWFIYVMNFDFFSVIMLD